MGYNQTAVNVSESDGMAQLTVTVLMPPEADPIETSFYLIVNTSDGTARDLPGLPWLNFIMVYWITAGTYFTGQKPNSGKVFVVQYQTDNTTSSISSEPFHICLLQ